MRVIQGGNLSFAAVGATRPRLPGAAVPFGYVVDGTMTVDVSPKDTRYSPAERAMKRATLPRLRFPGFPIPITEDVTFVGTNFEQENPHTAGVFSIAPGVKVVFGDGTLLGSCRLINVTLPDGVEILSGNLRHLVRLPSGDPARPVRLFGCECYKCATAIAEIRDLHALSPEERKALGVHDGAVWVHHALKPRYAERRKAAAVVDADMAAATARNAAAASALGKTFTLAERTKLRRGVKAVAVAEEV